MKKFWEILLILNLVLFIIDLSINSPIAAMFQGFMAAWCYYQVTNL